jgi:ABC-type sulfate transport system permease subunit
MLVLEIACIIILIEAITNLVSKSGLFKPMREFLFNKGENKLFRFIHTLVDCPYCLSVWVSLLCVVLLYLYINNWLPFIFVGACVSIIFHRFANVLHFIIDRIDSNHIGLDKDNE